MTDPPQPDAPSTTSRLRLNLALYLVMLLTAAACVVVGVKVYRAIDDEPSPDLPSASGLSIGTLAEASDEEEERVAAVIDAATNLATAFVNIRHDDLQASLDAVADRSTGSFRRDIVSSEGNVKRLITQSRAITEGSVIWAAVQSADQDSAKVLVATEGTVSNKTTQGKPTARYYRLLLDLVNVDGEWLTSSLEFVA